MIGTPGRLIDLAESGRLSFKDVGYLVIDEADRLFDMGFLPDLRKIIRKMPERTRRQSMLFSATLNRVSRLVAAEYLNDPVSIDVTPEQLTVDTITQEIYHVKSHIKLNLLLGLLQRNAPRNVLIFANMRHHAFRLAKELEANGYRAFYLSGDLPQKDRLRVIHDFMAGKFPILVATDVAARGLDIEDLEMVINYDVPQDFENYVHRIGRTARAGKGGKAITLASEGTSAHLEAIERFIGMKIPEKRVTDDLFARDLSLEKMPKQGWGRGPRPAGEAVRTQAEAPGATAVTAAAGAAPARGAEPSQGRGKPLRPFVSQGEDLCSIRLAPGPQLPRGGDFEQVGHPAEPGLEPVAERPERVADLGGHAVLPGQAIAVGLHRLDLGGERFPPLSAGSARPGPAELRQLALEHRQDEPMDPHEMHVLAHGQGVLVVGVRRVAAGPAELEAGAVHRRLLEPGIVGDDIEIIVFAGAHPLVEERLGAGSSGNPRSGGPSRRRS